MIWAEIERIGRNIYNLSEDWILCGAYASDPNVMQIEFGKKGTRGGWLKGKKTLLRDLSATINSIFLDTQYVKTLQ